jgi:hypothetical protein
MGTNLARPIPLTIQTRDLWAERAKWLIDHCEDDLAVALNTLALTEILKLENEFFYRSRKLPTDAEGFLECVVCHQERLFYSVPMCTRCIRFFGTHWNNWPEWLKELNRIRDREAKKTARYPEYLFSDFELSDQE